MFALDVLSRIIHVGTVIALIGGSTFTLLVLMPSARELSDETHNRLADAIQARWKRFVHIGVTLILISGLYNYVQAIPNHKGDSLYHALIGTKILVALVVFLYRGRAGWAKRETGTDPPSQSQMVDHFVAVGCCDHRDFRIRQGPRRAGRFHPVRVKLPSEPTKQCKPGG